MISMVGYSVMGGALITDPFETRLLLGIIALLLIISGNAGQLWEFRRSHR